jgi:perosamine synthetase
LRSVIPLSIPSIGEQELRNLTECINTNFVSSVGAFVNKFEEEIGRISGTAAGISTSSGTTALHLALVSAGIPQGSLVICPTFTFIASANAIMHAGAKPWLMDIDDASWTLCPEQLRDNLKSETEFRSGKTIHRASGLEVSAVIPVYTLGVVAQMDEINQVAKKFNLKVIADAACALGAKYKKRDLGTLATLSTYSFNGNKNITSGAGGMVVGSDPTLLKHVKHLASTGRTGTDYNHDVVAYNYRMSNIQAAVGCAQVEKLPTFLQAKAAIRNRYDEALENFGELFPNPQWSQSTYWFSGLVLKKQSVDEVCRKLKEKQIEARGFWKPIHLQEPYKKTPQNLTGKSEQLWQNILTLPCSTNLTVEDQNYVIQELRQILERR